MPNVLLNLNNLSEPYMPGDSFLINEGDTSFLSGSITSPGTQNLFDSIATELKCKAIAENLISDFT